MRKNSKYMNNQKGFIFPFTLITVMILFLVLLTTVSRFEHEITMTKNIQDHFIFESLFSLAEPHKETTFSKDSTLPESKTFSFPQGTVVMTYTSTYSQFSIQYSMSLNNGKEYSVYQSYQWESIIDDNDDFPN